MKIIRYLDSAGRAHHGSEQPDGSALRIEGDIFGSHRVTTERADLRKLLAPVVPAQILCIGLNYRQHAEETKAKIPERPILFVKGINTLAHPGDPILIPQHLRSNEVDYECELAVVIGKGGRDITQADAWNHVFGITAGQDISDRAVQMASKPPHFDLGKSFDTFGPIGPVVVSPDALPNRDVISIKCLVNGEERQNDTSANLIFGIPFLIEYLSHITTLQTGDVIFTGTPAGVGMMQKKLLRDGDTVTTIVEGVGTMVNACKRIADHNLPLKKKG